jgi:membrane protease YdiL (CAAX protease family)
MRPVRSLFIYLAAIFLGGALLAPWLYWLAQSFAHTFPRLADAPFHRYVNRSFLIIAILGLRPLLRQLGVKSMRELGLARPAANRHKLFSGFALGFVSLAIIAVLSLLAHARGWNGNLSPAESATKILGALATAAVVALLEEILFRGGIFGGLRRVFDWRLAVIVSSAVYALAHFFQRAEFSGTVAWDSGLALLPQMLRGFGDSHALVPGFFNLTLAGALLALAVQRTGSLWFSVGLHAGWIFWLKTFGAFTTELPGAKIWFWGTDKLIDGWLAFAVLFAALEIFRRSAMKKP